MRLQSNLTGAIEKLTALEKQTRQVSAHLFASTISN